MTPLPRRQTLCRIVFSTVLLTAGSFVLADSPNCDIRQLALSSSQQEQLRQVRAEYRQRMDNLVAQSRNLRQYTTQASNLVLSGPVFDENMARHYVNEKYTPQMQREVENLRAQHALLQILTPQQRQEWRRHCQYQ
ncbi:Spy/CpxP family protein refolding chaperone [Eikenella corrodens]|uniref:Spy/CpxP family protein refolding chaperone n=1 Tax=Eikenella corrodens TaxID=539 RepID=UPI00241D6E43|nr:Spy/CpxP family protein refolding chaperone [Eikenella corrodens]